MKHYHGTPVGGEKSKRLIFIEGRHLLVCFPNPEDIEDVAQYSRSFILDNGAFIDWGKGKRVDYDAYIAWVERWYRNPRYEFSIIPDIIDGSEKENREWVDRYPREFQGAPVYHMHESFDYLEHLVSNFRVVCLGSSGQWSHPGTPPWRKRMKQIMEVACDSQGRPYCKLHGLRMLNPDIFTQYPLSSADSTNAVVNAGSIARWGSYPGQCRMARAAHIARGIECHNSPSFFDEDQAQQEFQLC